jgi:hypothetical protein
MPTDNTSLEEREATICHTLGFQRLLERSRTRYFIWDNLNVHKSPLVYEAFKGGGRARPSCMTCDGPNKYMFCKLEAALSKNLAPISSIDDLITAVRNIVSALKGPDKTFQHCGYRW